MAAASENLFDTDIPLVAAPMAGGPTTPRLLAAAHRAGAFGFLPAGYRDADALAGRLAQLHADGVQFGVNLFVPGDSGIDPDTYRRYAERLRPEGEPYGIDPAAVPPTESDDGWRDKIDLLLAHPVPWVSTTFGLPEPAAVAALQRAGTRVLATVTGPEEAAAAQAAGVDALVVQGTDAGGHSGVHDPHRTLPPADTADLVRTVRRAVPLPVVAAGGVDGPRRVRELRDTGAAAVAVGTLLLRTDESGASPVHRDALADSAYDGTAVTRAFTGRPARALRNGFLARHDAEAPTGYPAVHFLTRPLRSAAAAAGDADRVHLWAGTGYRSARTGPAADVLTGLAAEL